MTSAVDWLMSKFGTNFARNSKFHIRMTVLCELRDSVTPALLKRYTWRKRAPLKQARLDYFLISDAMLPTVNKSSIEGSYRSDHSMIILELSFIQFKKGKPLWKHNNSLLYDEDYLKIINGKI